MPGGGGDLGAWFWCEGWPPVRNAGGVTVVGSVGNRGRWVVRQAGAQTSVVGSGGTNFGGMVLVWGGIGRECG